MHVRILGRSQPHLPLHLKQVRAVVCWRECHDQVLPVTGAQPKPLGVSNGFLVPPLRLMHCDTLEVFANRPGALASPEERQHAEGVGLLLRTAVFAHGHSCGCTKAEILAINDDGEQSLLCEMLLQSSICW